MQFKFKNLLYNQMKEICEHRNDRSYVIKHILVVLAFFIMLIRVVMGIGSYLLNIEAFQYWRYDPFTYFVYVYFENSFALYTFIISMPFCFGILATIIFCFQRVDTITYQIYYDLIVLNTDQINNCSISETKQSLLSNNKCENYLAKFCHLPFIAHFPAVQFFWKQICWHLAKIQLKLNGQFVDQGKISKCSLGTIPNVSVEFRLKIALAIAVFEKLYYLAHLIKGI